MLKVNDSKIGQTVKEMVSLLKTDIYKMSITETNQFINKVYQVGKKYPSSYIYIALYIKDNTVHFIHNDQNKRKNTKFVKCLGGVAFDLHITNKDFFNKFNDVFYDPSGKVYFQLKKEAIDFILNKSLDFEKEYYEMHLKHNNGNKQESLFKGYTDPKDYDIEDLKEIIVDYLPQKEWSSYKRFIQNFRETKISDYLLNEVIIPEFYEMLTFYQNPKVYSDKTRILYFLTMTYFAKDEKEFADIMKDVRFVSINMKDIIEVNINKQRKDWKKYFIEK